MIQGVDSKDIIHRLRKLENDSIDVASVGAGVNADFPTVAAAFAAGNRIILVKEGKQVAITGDIAAAVGDTQITITAKDHGLIVDQPIAIDETGTDGNGNKLEGIFKVDSVTDNDNFKITLSGDGTGISGGITASGFVKYVVDSQIDIDSDTQELEIRGESRTNSIWTSTVGNMIIGDDAENKRFENLRLIPFSDFSVWRATGGGLKNITFKNNLFNGFHDGHENWDIPKQFIQFGSNSGTPAISQQIRFLENDKIGSSKPRPAPDQLGGFMFTHCEHMDLSHNYFERLNVVTAFNQIFFGKQCKNVKLSLNDAKEMGNAFVFTRDTGAELVMISFNTIEGEPNGPGIQVGDNSEGASIVGNTVSGFFDGISLTGDFGNATGNTVKDCTRAGILVLGLANDVTVGENMIENCVTNIFILSPSNGVNISGNVSVNATTGILIQSGARVCVVGNTFRDNTTNRSGVGAAGSIIAHNIETP